MPVLMTLLVCLLLSVSAGLAADTYVNILTQPGQVLAFWARWLYALKEKFVMHGQPPANEHGVTFATPEDSATYLHRMAVSEYILKPLLTCVYCVGGQLGFWLSVYCSVVFHQRFSLLWALLTAVLSVWFGGLFQSIQKKYFPL